MKHLEEEIIKLEYQLIEAIKTSNISFIDKILHNDLLFIAPNGQVVTKAMDIASHQSGQMVVDELTPHFEDCKVIDDTAISIVVYNTKGTMLGQPISGQFRYIRNWKLFTEGFQIISGACIAIS